MKSSFPLLPSVQLVFVVFVVHGRGFAADDETNNVTQISHVPFHITSPGIYRLTTNVQYRQATGAAITIDSSDVTLDLGGHTVRGLSGSESTAIGILAVDQHNIAIKNGRVAGFYFGIDIRATDRDTRKSNGHLICNIIAERNWYFGMRVVGSRSEIKNCKILDTGGSMKKGHTIPHGVRLVGKHNALRNSHICDLRLKQFGGGKGEIVGVHFDAAKGSILENNTIAEFKKPTDNQFPADDPRERRFGVWVNGGPQKDTFLTVRGNTFCGFTVPLAFAPGSDGRVTGNVFYNADKRPIRGKPAAQLEDNVNCP